MYEGVNRFCEQPHSSKVPIPRAISGGCVSPLESTILTLVYLRLLVVGKLRYCLEHSCNPNARLLRAWSRTSRVLPCPSPLTCPDIYKTALVKVTKSTEYSVLSNVPSLKTWLLRFLSIPLQRPKPDSDPPLCLFWWFEMSRPVHKRRIVSLTNPAPLSLWLSNFLIWFMLSVLLPCCLDS